MSGKRFTPRPRGASLAAGAWARTLLPGRVGTDLMLFTVYVCSLPSTVSLICRLTSRDVCVSGLKDRLAPPPSNRTSPTSERLVVGLLRSNPYRSLRNNVMCSNCSVSVRFSRWCARRDLWIVCFPPPSHGERMIVLLYRSDGQGFIVWGHTHVGSSVYCKLGGIVL